MYLAVSTSEKERREQRYMQEDVLAFPVTFACRDHLTRWNKLLSYGVMLRQSIVKNKACLILVKKLTGYKTTDRLTDRLPDWLTDWQTDWLDSD